MKSSHKRVHALHEIVATRFLFLVYMFLECAMPFIYMYTSVLERPSIICMLVLMSICIYVPCEWHIHGSSRHERHCSVFTSV